MLSRDLVPIAPEWVTDIGKPLPIAVDIASALDTPAPAMVHSFGVVVAMWLAA
jgi:hypothetical protein